MIYGEHLGADEIAVHCACGVVASVEVVDSSGRAHGWFCRRHAARKRDALRNATPRTRASTGACP